MKSPIYRWNHPVCNIPNESHARAGKELSIVLKDAVNALQYFAIIVSTHENGPCIRQLLGEISEGDRNACKEHLRWMHKQSTSDITDSIGF